MKVIYQLCCGVDVHKSFLCHKNKQTDNLLVPTQYDETLYKSSYRNNNAGLDASYVKSDNIRFSSTYQNISSVE